MEIMENAVSKTVKTGEPQGDWNKCEQFFTRSDSNFVNLHKMKV